MPEYYLDIETNANGSKPDVENDEILTIQFQRLGIMDANMCPCCKRDNVRTFNPDLE